MRHDPINITLTEFRKGVPTVVLGPTKSKATGSRRCGGRRTCSVTALGALHRLGRALPLKQVSHARHGAKRKKDGPLQTRSSQLLRR